MEAGTLHYLSKPDPTWDNKLQTLKFNILSVTFQKKWWKTIAGSKCKIQNGSIHLGYWAADGSP